MVLANKTNYADVAKQVDGLKKKKEKNKSSFFGKRIKVNREGNKQQNPDLDQNKKEEEKIQKEKKAAEKEMQKQKEKERQERLEAKRKTKEQKIKEREKQKAEREKERAKALEAKRKAKEDKQKEKERLAKEKEEQQRKEQEQREKEQAKELELKRQAEEAEKREKERLAKEREEKLKKERKMREKRKLELEKERQRQIELKKKAEKEERIKREKLEQERIKEKERLAKEKEEQQRKEQEQREKERAKELELKRKAEEEKIEEKERIEKDREEQRKKMEAEKLKQAELERQAVREEMQKQKEKERQERLEAKRKAKEEKIKEREKKKAEKEKEKAKALEAKKKAKEEKQKEKKRIAKEKEEQQRKEQEQKEKERAKELELKRQAEEAEKRKLELMKLKEQKQVFDQSKIEVVKTMDREVINLRDENELSKVVDDIYEGDVIYERTGFGWKGLGSRRIIFDDNLKQYVYEIIEPKLSDDEEKLKDRLVHLFRTRAEVDVSHLQNKMKMEILEKTLNDLIDKYRIEMNPKSKEKIYYYIYQDFVGFGKIDIPMHDEGIEDISCDGVDIPIFIYHKNLESIRTNIIFRNPDELDSFVIKLSQMCGKQISVYEPVVDGKLDDGSRLQVTLGKTITKDSTFTIRRFREDPLTPVDLIENNTMDLDMAAYFWLIIEKGASVLFCGGTASGKTTMLNALSLFLPNSYKIVSVEDTREINLPHENWIAGTTRTGFSSSEIGKTGKDIDMFDLLRVALRQRPKAIIVGEVRGKEAYTLFQAMTTGHLSYSTVHASDMHSLIQRLESPPISLPRSLLTSLDMVVFLNSLTIEGKPVRRITNVTEIIKLDPETNRLVTVSPFYWISEVEDKFENTGGSKILNKIKLENMWTDEKLENELDARKKVLKWMIKNKLRSYSEVGKTISEFYNNRKEFLKKIGVSK